MTAMDKIFNVLVLLLVGLMLLALIGLGFWQLDRARQKRDLLDQYHAAEGIAPKPLNAFEPLPQFTPVVVRGHFRGDRSIWLQNRFRDGLPGVEHYRLFQPVQGPAMLANLGWLRQRSDVALTSSSVETRVSGLLAPPPKVGFQLGTVIQPASAVDDIETPYLDLPEIARLLGVELAPSVLLLSEPAADYVRKWQPTVADPNRNIGYAVQWFALAGTLLIAVVIFLLRERRRRA